MILEITNNLDEKSWRDVDFFKVSDGGSALTFREGTVHERHIKIREMKDIRLHGNGTLFYIWSRS
jgi:hypothetical protein